jgi:outer membrane protein
MRKSSSLLTLVSLFLLAHQGASAADMPYGNVQPVAEPLSMPFFVHFGPAAVALNESAKVKLLGNLVPGASVSIAPQLTVAVEAGYFITPNVAVSFTGGFPPTVDIMGKGALAGLGRLGTTTYGPTTLTAHYHFTGMGRFQPYIGAGPTFMVVFGSKDGALSNLKVNNAVGFALQIGADYMVTDKWGVFVDVKKAFLKTTATGTLGGAGTKSSVTLDPLVVHTGVTYRF